MSFFFCIAINCSRLVWDFRCFILLLFICFYAWKTRITVSTESNKRSDKSYLLHRYIEKNIVFFVFVAFFLLHSVYRLRILYMTAKTKFSFHIFVHRLYLSMFFSRLFYPVPGVRRFCFSFIHWSRLEMHLHTSLLFPKGLTVIPFLFRLSFQNSDNINSYLDKTQKKTYSFYIIYLFLYFVRCFSSVVCRHHCRFTFLLDTLSHP